MKTSTKIGIGVGAYLGLAWFDKNVLEIGLGQLNIFRVLEEHKGSVGAIDRGAYLRAFKPYQSYQPSPYAAGDRFTRQVERGRAGNYGDRISSPDRPFGPGRIEVGIEGEWITTRDIPTYRFAMGSAFPGSLIHANVRFTTDSANMNGYLRIANSDLWIRIGDPISAYGLKAL